jgi:hypothetical protein
MYQSIKMYKCIYQYSGNEAGDNKKSFNPNMLKRIKAFLFSNIMKF